MVLPGSLEMRSRPSVNEVAENFSEYIDRVGRGERFVLMQGKTPVAELRPVAPGRRLQELPEILASLPHLSPEELGAFESDLAAARPRLKDLLLAESPRAEIPEPPRRG
jgi:antitoxin (DNA-binding transcriptional repressor) of toxin-antitoxin stability system